MNRYFKILDWDSRFFGYKIASVHVSDLKQDKLSEILNDLKKESCKLVYCFADPIDEVTNNSILKFSGMLVDEKVTFSIQGFNENKSFTSGHIQPYILTFPSDLIKGLALQSGIYSRFKVDPGFRNSEYEKLYTEWIVNSIDKSFADEILVYYDDNEEKGFISLSTKNNIGSIGLLAVDERERGKSIGKKLINATFAYFVNKAVSEIEVVTQKANGTACAFYESQGFKVKNITNVYHIWIK
jgi:dTDP-4-amino-4,6-dideoxy-D-galactose acyltransferase